MGIKELFKKKDTPNKQELEQIAAIKNAVLRIVEDATEKGRFSLFMCSDMKKVFNSPTIKLDTLNFFYNIGLDHDKNCNIPLNFGLYLDKLSLDESIVVGVHREKIYYGEKKNGVPESDKLDDMMCNGFINYGHLNAIGGVAYIKIPSPSLTFTPLKGLTGFVNLVGSYHDNNSVILAGFPSNLVDESLGIIDYDRVDELYDMSEINPRVRPNYMMGVIIKNDEGLDDVFTRDEILSSRLNK